jgi:hypothetical protein
MPTLWLANSNSITVNTNETFTLTAYMDPSGLNSGISAYGARIRYGSNVYGQTFSWEDNGTWECELEYSFSSPGTYSVSVGLTDKYGAYLGYPTGSIKIYVEEEEEYILPTIELDIDSIDESATESSVMVSGKATRGYSNDNNTYRIEYSVVKTAGGGAKTYKSDSFTFSSKTRSFSHEFTGLDSGISYKATVELRNLSSNDVVAIDYYTFSTGKKIRPKNWEWTSTVSAGAAVTTTKISGTENSYNAYFLTAAEWIDFIDRIKEFASYLDVSFTQMNDVAPCTRDVIKGKPMKYTQALGARNFINKLDPPKAVPSISSTSTITAAFINGLKDSLNSIK